MEKGKRWYFIDNKRSCLIENERSCLDTGVEVRAMNCLGGRVGWNEGEVFVDVRDDSERAGEEGFE